MLAVKENSKKRQDYYQVINFLVTETEVDVNLQAEKARLQYYQMQFQQILFLTPIVC